MIAGESAATFITLKWLSIQWILIMKGWGCYYQKPLCATTVLASTVDLMTAIDLMTAYWLQHSTVLDAKKRRKETGDSIIR